MTLETLERTHSEVLKDGVCRHRWMIESPQSSTPLGVCNSCQTTRKSPNYFEDTLRAGFRERTAVFLDGSQLFETHEPKLEYQAKNQEE